MEERRFTGYVWIWCCLVYTALSCGSAPSVSHATLSYSYVNSLRIATYTCDAANGYVARGNNTIACLQLHGYSVWTSVQVTCQRVQCQSTPSLSRATRNRQVESRQELYYRRSYGYYGYSRSYRTSSYYSTVYFLSRNLPTIYFNGFVAFTCNSNYYLPNGTQDVRMYCGSDGRWITPQEQCQGKNCGAIRAMVGVRCSSGSTRYPVSRSCACLSGYERIGYQSSFSLSCQSSGSWSSPSNGYYARCTKISCGNPPTVNNSVSAATSSTGTRYQDTTSYTCLPGYEVTAGSSTISCRANRHWSTAPTCSKKNCGRPPTVTHGRLLRQAYNTTYDSEISYECNSIGYTMLGSPTIRCTEDGTWSRPPLCFKTVCGPPPAVLHAKTFTAGHSYGDNVTYECEAGYDIRGNSTIECLVYGHWSIPPVCRAKSCPDPPEIENAEKLALTSGTVVGSVVKYICIPGYQIVGEPKVTCLPTLGWSTSPRCTKARCGDPYAVSNSRREVGGHYYNDITVYTCFHGYQLFGNSTIYCQKDGHWSIPPECHAIGCGIPPPVENAHIKSLTGFYVGKTVFYECLIGYSTSDLKFITCMVDGEWSPPPACEGIETTTAAKTSLERLTAAFTTESATNEVLLYTEDDEKSITAKKIPDTTVSTTEAVPDTTVSTTEAVPDTTVSTTESIPDTTVSTTEENSDTTVHSTEMIPDTTVHTTETLKNYTTFYLPSETFLNRHTEKKVLSTSTVETSNRTSQSPTTASLSTKTLLKKHTLAVTTEQLSVTEAEPTQAKTSPLPNTTLSQAAKFNLTTKQTSMSTSTISVTNTSDSTQQTTSSISQITDLGLRLTKESKKDINFSTVSPFQAENVNFNNFDTTGYKQQTDLERSTLISSEYISSSTTQGNHTVILNNVSETKNVGYKYSVLKVTAKPTQQFHHSTPESLTGNKSKAAVKLGGNSSLAEGPAQPNYSKKIASAKRKFSSKKDKSVVIGSLIPSSFVVAVIAIIIWMLIKRRRQRQHNFVPVSNPIYDSEAETMTICSYRSRRDSSEDVQDSQKHLMEEEEE